MANEAIKYCNKPLFNIVFDQVKAKTISLVVSKITLNWSMACNI